MTETDEIDFKPIEIPRIRRGYWGLLKIVLALVAIAAASWAWSAGYRPPFLGKDRQEKLALVEIDRGDINLVVVETGTVESSNNRTIRCTVEALLGQVGGSQGTGTGKAAGGAGGAGGQGASGAGGAGGGQSAAPAATAKSKTATKAGGSSTTAAGGTATGTSKTSSSATAGASTATAATDSSASSSSASSSTTSTVAKKPVIRSFTYVVPKYVSLRPVTAKAVDTAAQKKAQQSAQGGGGGGGGGGGRGGRGGGRRGGGNMEEEKPGSTTIVDIIPAGTRVKAGDVVCRLDSSVFEDEERAQRIRHIQAKSYVEQANAVLEVNQITLREYRDGIYPQDVALVKQYILTCQLEHDRLERAVAWSREMESKGFRTRYQVKGDELAYEQAKIALGEAENMLSRLTKQTGPKLRTALEANVEAIKADKYTQEASYQLETQRLERIRKNIKSCTLVAPSDGIVVWCNEANRWGQVTAPIDQGVTVRQDQPIINLPDPLHMRVKARINESKLSLVHTGQYARIVVDAYPDHPLTGRVAEVTPINVPLNASDVRVYYANVDIETGFDDLRPGLSAEVSFMVDSRRDVARIPLESIRWVGEQGYAAVQNGSSEPGNPGSWTWRPIKIGMTDTHYAEVLSGLQAGDRVVAAPRGLTAPVPESIRTQPTRVAGLTP